MLTGLWRNNPPENNLPLNSDTLWKNSASSRSPLILLKPRAASSAPGAPLEPPGQRTSPCSGHHFVGSQPRARPFLRRLQSALRTSRRRRRFRLSPPAPPLRLARCLRLRYQRVVAADHTVTFGAQAIALPPLSAHRGYAGESVELSHQLDGLLRVLRADTLLTVLPFAFEEHAARRPVQLTSAQKRQPTMPPSTTLPAALLSRPLLKRYGVPKSSLQLIRHSLVATTAGQ
jgi:hypothetical protein